MAFPIFGNPRPVWPAAADGTLELTEPTDSTDKTYYPTADDADAGTNGATGAINLDSNGMVPDGLYGIDDQKYRVELKDSSGQQIFLEDDNRLPVRTPTLSGATAQTLTDAGAVTLTEQTTHIVTTTASALTLADGSEEQRKTIVMKTDAGVATLTPDNFANGTTITFSNVGDSAELIFANASWHWLGGSAYVTGAPSTALLKYKTADESDTAGALQDDDHMVGWSPEPATYYRVLGHLKVNTGASSTPDIQWAFSFTAGSPVESWLTYDNVNDAGTAVSDTSAMTTTTNTSLIANQIHGITLVGHFLSHATATATLDFTWGQNTADATATVLERGSWISIEKMGA